MSVIKSEKLVGFGPVVMATTRNEEGQGSIPAVAILSLQFFC
jgi:hypothetical protein